MLRTLELFAGIGGLRLGFESVGEFEFTRACEISESARAVYKSHWPDTPIEPDIRDFRGSPGDFDSIIGGSPCQDLSGCGKRAGLDGEQSSLWWEMLRIITECRPSFVGWENVEGALSRGAREVIASLRMVGYKVEDPIVISAEELGAPHGRKRIFVAAYSNYLSERIEAGDLAGWEEQLGNQIEIASTYTTSQRRLSRPQYRENRGSEHNGVTEARSAFDAGGNGESSDLGVDDGISGELVRVGADAGWLEDISRSGWWERSQPPTRVGIPGKNIAGRRESISHYGAACIPAQCIPLALRIKYLADRARIG